MNQYEELRRHKVPVDLAAGRRSNAHVQDAM